MTTQLNHFARRQFTVHSHSLSRLRAKTPVFLVFCPSYELGVDACQNTLSKAKVKD